MSKSVETVKGLAPEIAEIFGLTTPEKTDNTALSVSDQKQALFDAITADSPTPSELWNRMREANYALTPSKKLFTEAWGADTGALYAQTLKAEVDRFIACLLKYEQVKHTAPKSANTQMKNALFDMGRALSARCGLEVDKIKPAQLDSIASHAYRYGYADRGDIKKGWMARPATTWATLSFMLKELSASSTLTAAAETAATRYCRSAQYLAKLSES